MPVKNETKTKKKVNGRLFQKGNKYGKGRPPKVKCIPDILKKIGEEDGTKDGKYSKLDVVMRRVFEFALEGRPWAVQFIADRTEGKPVERLAIDNTEAPFVIWQRKLAEDKD